MGRGLRLAGHPPLALTALVFILGRSSIYLGTCQDEPEQLDDWNRIAELQQRNRACPPHLKTCYPLESRVRGGAGGCPFPCRAWRPVSASPPPQPSNSLGTITDEEMKTGDPKETLRRASMQPAQITEGTAARRSTMSTAWAGGITTRQQRKRLSDESHQGPDTPEVSRAPPPAPPGAGGIGVLPQDVVMAAHGDPAPSPSASPRRSPPRGCVPGVWPLAEVPSCPLSSSPRSPSAASRAPRPPGTAASGAAPRSAGAASSRRPASR